MSRKLFRIISSFFWLAGLLGIIGCVTEKDEPQWALQAGDALPNFEVMTISGDTVRSADSYEATLIIVFFNTTCSDCQRELPEIQRQYEENLSLPEEERSIYICISREEGAPDVERYWQKEHLTLPVSAQNDRRIYSMFASIGIPRIFKSRNGEIMESIYHP